MRLDESAIMWSAPERERAGRPLLVLLHGYGSHEGDLFGMAPGLPLGPVIASVRAPIAENGGWAWFSLGDSVPGDPDPARVDAAASAVLEWLDTVDYTSVSILGFSQGAALALQVLRLAPDRITATVALSGLGYSVYSGDDALVLGYLAHGAVGLVSVAAHAASAPLRTLIEQFEAGDHQGALATYTSLLPAFHAVMGVTHYGATTAKASLELLGVLDNRNVRGPLVPLDDAEVEALRAGLAASGLI
jgi:pimeloyl-ACP methyl ester carboxylesterase